MDAAVRVVIILLLVAAFVVAVGAGVVLFGAVANHGDDYGPDAMELTTEPTWYGTGGTHDVTPAEIVFLPFRELIGDTNYPIGIFGTVMTFITAVVAFRFLRKLLQ